MINLCPPAIIYLLFSITQILIDIFKELYNTAFIKVIVMIMITVLLNFLCQNGLGVISWIIVFIPFILMTVIVSLLLYVFGLNPTKVLYSFVNDNYLDLRRANVITKPIQNIKKTVCTNNSDINSLDEESIKELKHTDDDNIDNLLKQYTVIEKISIGQQ